MPFVLIFLENKLLFKSFQTATPISTDHTCTHMIKSVQLKIKNKINKTQCCQYLISSVSISNAWVTRENWLTGLELYIIYARNFVGEMHQLRGCEKPTLILRFREQWSNYKEYTISDFWFLGHIHTSDLFLSWRYIQFVF